MSQVAERVTVDLRPAPHSAAQPVAVEVVVEGTFTGSVELHFRDGRFVDADQRRRVRVHGDLMREG